MTRAHFLPSILALTIAAFAITGCSTKTAPKDVKAGSGTGDGSGMDGIGLGSLQRIYFDFNKSDISSASAEILKSNAALMKKNPAMKVLVEGHCDERGTHEYNIALGERRAKAALNYLVAQGIARTKVEMKSWGSEKPLDAGHDESAWSKNRRDEFVILAK